MQNDIKKIDKGLIFLKSSVIALGIVLVVLMAALLIIKNKKSANVNSECPKDVSINVEEKIEKIEINGNYIWVTTKENKGSKRVIKIDNCGKIVSKIKLQK